MEQQPPALPGHMATGKHAFASDQKHQHWGVSHKPKLFSS